MSDIIHKLEEMWLAQLSLKKQRMNASRWVNVHTERSTDKPPITAPYNFAIDREWLAKFSTKFPSDLRDWGDYDNPAGFGETGNTENDDSTVAGPSSDGPSSIN